MKNNILLIIFMTAIFLNAPLAISDEPDVKSFEKIYENGDSIKIECVAKSNERCVLYAKIASKEKKYDLNFSFQNEIPTLESVRMIDPGVSPWAFSAAVSVECAGRDESVLPDSVPDVMCFKYLYLNGSGDVRWGATFAVGQMHAIPVSVNGRAAE